MQREQEMVEAFHIRFGFRNQEADCPEVDQRLREIGDTLASASEGMKQEGIKWMDKGDVRLYRAHLLIEELGELLFSLGDQDRIETADALGDLLYVTLGTAVVMDLPAEAIFHEIHRSNMTKRRTKEDPRMKNKGEDYIPPDIATVIGEPR